MARGDSATSLAPGFRFHPTDEELVRYYLKRKVVNKPLRFDHIAVVDIYKVEPWDLPGMSKLKSRDLEWYFFSSLDRKYGNGSKTNRATEKGYWKTTGKDRPVRFNSRTVGMKKTLVYHLGRAPRGERTNWVMHEYRLADEDLEKAGISQDSFVLCRIFQKSGTGPKNGEQYGAPFVEEEWDDEEEVALFPNDFMIAADEMTVGENEYVEVNDLEQECDARIESNNSDLPLNFYHGDMIDYEETDGIVGENDEKPIIIRPENWFNPYLADDQKMVNLPEQFEVDGKPAKEQYVAESSNIANGDFNYLIDEPYFDATNDLPFEPNDLLNTTEADSARDATGFDMLEEYLSFFDAGDGNFTFDPSELLGDENAVPEQGAVPQEDVNRKTKEMPEASQTPLSAECIGDNEASTSNPKAETKLPFDSDVKNSFLKQASNMLGSIPAPSAFAAEFPVKGAALRRNSAHSSGSIRVTAGMIRIDNMLPSTNGIDWSLGKNGTVNIILSFNLLLRDESITDRSLPVASPFFGKTGSLVSRSLFLVILLWVLILSVSYKVRTYIYSK